MFFCGTEIKNHLLLQEKLNFDDMELNDFINKGKKEELILVIPQGNNRSINHVFTVCNGLIYDSTQQYLMVLLEESIHFICGNCGCRKIYKSRKFYFKIN